MDVLCPMKNHIILSGTLRAFQFIFCVHILHIFLWRKYNKFICLRYIVFFVGKSILWLCWSITFPKKKTKHAPKWNRRCNDGVFVQIFFKKNRLKLTETTIFPHPKKGDEMHFFSKSLWGKRNHVVVHQTLVSPDFFFEIVRGNNWPCPH